MIKVENIDIWGFDHAIRGMRNPMNSWDKSDSGYGLDGEDEDVFVIGPKDLELMRKLYLAGPEHRKYLRQIFVSMDITAPLYYWKEADTYKVGTVANSCSTMHRIAAKEFELDDFSHDHLILPNECHLKKTIERLNECREWYLKYDSMPEKDKEHFAPEIKSKKDLWWQLIQLLPSSYNQKRTVTMNYENVVSMIHQRTGHKLDEWNEFVEKLRSLPYMEEIIKE